MGMNIHNYDPKDVTVTIESDAFGTFAITNLGEDDIECSQDNDSASSSVGLHGDVVMNQSHDKRGSIKFPVQASSPQLSTLKKMANVTDVFGIWVVNKSTGEKTGGTTAYFKKPADNKAGSSLNDRSYEAQVLDYTDN